MSIVGCNAILGIDEHERAPAAAGGAAGSEITAGSEGNPGGIAGAGGTPDDTAVDAGGSGGTLMPTAGSAQGGAAGEGGGGNGGGSAANAGQGPNSAGGSAGRGGSPPTSGGASSGTGGAGGGSLSPCTGNGIGNCGKGFTCFNGICAPAATSCAEHFRTYHQEDGVYWIDYGGIHLRTYCDMVLKRELFREVDNGEQREGQTRQSMPLQYLMKARLDWTAGVCTIWAVRSKPPTPTGESVPLGPLYRNVGTVDAPKEELRPIETCNVLGFTGSTAKSELGDCPYGEALTQCGFKAGNKNYSNWCLGNPLSCPMSMKGETYAYELTGPIVTGSLLSDMDGQTSSRCAVR